VWNPLRFALFAIGLLTLGFLAVEQSDRSDSDLRQEWTRRADQITAETEKLAERLRQAGSLTNERIEALLAESDRLRVEAARLAARLPESPVIEPGPQAEPVPGFFERGWESFVRNIDQLREWMREKRRD